MENLKHEKTAQIIEYRITALKNRLEKLNFSLNENFTYYAQFSLKEKVISEFALTRHNGLLEMLNENPNAVEGVLKTVKNNANHAIENFQIGDYVSQCEVKAWQMVLETIKEINKN